MAGRPSEYTKEIAIKIFEQISTTSKSLKTICKPEDMPSVRTVLKWLAEGDSAEGRPELKEFVRQYAYAKQEQADFLAEEIIEIADDGSNDLMKLHGNMVENKEVTNRSRLRVDARKWIASKLKPKKYGDRLDVNPEGGLTIHVKFQDDTE